MRRVFAAHERAVGPKGPLGPAREPAALTMPHFVLSAQRGQPVYLVKSNISLMLVARWSVLPSEPRPQFCSMNFSMDACSYSVCDT